MEKRDELKELAELKQQIRLLHEKLDAQNIVNRHHLQAAMKKNISYINHHARVEIILCLFALVNFQIIFHEWDFSTAFMVVTDAGLLSCIVAVIIYHYNIFSLDFSTRDLLSCSYEFSRLKQRYASWRKYSLPSVFVWMLWICGELYYMNNPMGISMAVGCLVGGAVGGVIGNRMYRRQVNRIDEMLVHIEELQGMKED